MYEFSSTRRVEFADTDMGGIMHFSRYFVFMETAEHQLFEAIGSSVMLQHEGRQLGWPRVAASCEYKQPARFGDVLEIRVRVRRKGQKSMTYEFSFARAGQEIATGRMTSVCCELDPAAGPRSIPIPGFLAARLDEPPAV